MSNKLLNLNKGKLVSVIVPVYNTEEYLRQCLSSLINQEYENIEIIIIDDGSSDGSLDICKEFASSDKRIVLIKSENMGAASARNKGLDKVKGHYVVFCDSDDWVNIEYIKTLYTEIESSGNDILLGGRSAYRDGHIEKTVYPCEIVSANSTPEAIRIELIMHYLENFRLGGNFAKIYKRSIIENNSVRFNESITVNEDILFNIEYLLNSKTAGIIDSADYFYRQREGSVTSSYDEGIAMGISMVAANKRRLVSEYGFMEQECREIINRWFVMRLISYYKRTAGDKSYNDFQKRYQRLRKLAGVLNEGMKKDGSLLSGLGLKTRMAAYAIGKFRLINQVVAFASHLNSYKGRKR